MQISKKEYQSPMVELMEARVERGFAGSGNTESQSMGTNRPLEGLSQNGSGHGNGDFMFN